jgi:hypothetical protein
LNVELGFHQENTAGNLRDWLGEYSTAVNMARAVILLVCQDSHLRSQRAIRHLLITWLFLAAVEHIPGYPSGAMPGFERDAHRYNFGL